MDVSRDGDKLIKDWLHAQRRLEGAKREVNSAECDLLNSTNALAKWMLPDDAKPGEKIAVWYGDSLIQVEPPPCHPVPGGDAKVTVRQRGRSISLAA